jgi:sporulation protein YlmC with PRC-barrel domain
MLTKFATAAAVAALVTGAAHAQQPNPPSRATTGVGSSAAQTMSSIPSNAETVTNWYKQDVYDPSDAKIGEISDVLVNQDGQVSAFIVSVGGFLGMGEKNVAVPFSAVHATQRNGKWWLTMNGTKDGLKGAPGYKFDKAKATWVPA